MFKGPIPKCMEPSSRWSTPCRFVHFLNYMCVDCRCEITPLSFFILNFFLTFLGDLLYLEVVTLEDVHANVTASTSGFYINRLDKLTKLANRFYG